MEVDYPETDWEWTLPRADGAIGQALDALDADIADLTALWENTSQEWREGEEGVETRSGSSKSSLLRGR